MKVTALQCTYNWFHCQDTRWKHFPFEKNGEEFKLILCTILYIIVKILHTQVYTMKSPVQPNKSNNTNSTKLNKLHFVAWSIIMLLII